MTHKPLNKNGVHGRTSGRKTWYPKKTKNIQSVQKSTCYWQSLFWTDLPGKKTHNAKCGEKALWWKSCHDLGLLCCLNTWIDRIDIDRKIHWSGHFAARIFCQLKLRSSWGIQQDYGPKYRNKSTIKKNALTEKAQQKTNKQTKSGVAQWEFWLRCFGSTDRFIPRILLDLNKFVFFKGITLNTFAGLMCKYITCLVDVSAAKSSTSYYIHYILFPPFTVNIYTIWSRRTWKHIIIYALCVQADCCLCLSVYFTLIANINISLK